MFKLAAPARQLMQKPRPDGKGNFGPSFLLISDSSGGAMSSKIRYADIQAYLTAILSKDNTPIDRSPHGVWWNISYHDFTTGQVPGLDDLGFQPIPIMDTKNPLQSAFYVILTQPNGLQGITQMPEGGPFITDPGYTTKLADGKTITGKEIMDNMKAWLKNGFPQ